MPQGNIGTPLEFFKEAISRCIISTDVLRKLGICDYLTKNRTSNVYGRVPLNYNKTFGEYVLGAPSGHDKVSHNEGQSIDVIKDRAYEFSISSRIEKEADVEEWDRYDALHDDVDEQQRTKHRLYEEPMEVVWEKGGSGLVYYTDDILWKGLEGKFDFDEDAADDWDVDMEIYDDPEAAVESAEGGLLSLKVSKQLRKGKPAASVLHPTTFKVSQFAINQMKKYGWEKGHSLGQNNAGIKSPITAEYRHPLSRAGLGNFTDFEEQTTDNIALQNYRRLSRLNKPMKHFITTKYDQVPSNERNYVKGIFGSTPWRSEQPTNLKYRAKSKGPDGAS